MGEERGRDRGRPLEPEEARAYGEDPEAVRYREGDATGTEGHVRRRGLGPNIDAEGRAREDFPTHEYRTAEQERVSPRYGRRETRGGRDNDDGYDLINRRDSARWGPVWAGLITALTTFLLLQLLAIGLGLVGIGPNDAGGGWVSGLIGLIAFFTGGAVAGMTSAVRGAATGLVNGFLVWALGTVLILLLSALGLGQVFGALGNVIGQIGLLQNLQGGVNVPDVDPAQVAQAVRTAAIGAFFGLLLSALAAMLGGYLGGRSSDPIGRMARDG